MKGFKVYRIDTSTGPIPTYSRRDLCTIYLLTGQHRLSWADQKIERDGTCLLFGNLPEATDSDQVAPHQMGYACRFTKEFAQVSGQSGSQKLWALWHGNRRSVFWLGREQAAYLTKVFQLMLAEQQNAYLFKHELLRSYLQLVFYEALRLHSPAPKHCFTYYFRPPGQHGVLSTSRRRRQRRLG